MIIEKTQGITLQSIPYKEKQRILSVFTKDRGIISLIIKGLSKKNSSFLALTSPFCLAEIIYKKGRSDISYLQDTSIIDENLLLRKNLAYINSAYFITKAILDSQLPHKQAPALYLLLNSYLKKIPFCVSQDSLVVSFLLKVLIYEGLLNLKNTCDQCSNEALAIQKGECLCLDHAAASAHLFLSEEINTLFQLVTVKSFSDLEKITCSTAFKEKTLKLFKDFIL